MSKNANWRNAENKLSGNWKRKKNLEKITKPICVRPFTTLGLGAKRADKIEIRVEGFC